MTRMFKEVTKTWSPVTGCNHACIYCWAKRLAETRLKHLPQYQNGFRPYFVVKELNRHFNSGTIFVSSMGDLFGQWMPEEWILSVLDTIRRSPDATFYLLTKNPCMYHYFIEQFRELPNVVLGVTIESNYIPIGISKADRPAVRAGLMQDLPRNLKRFVSIEPILEFNKIAFLTLIKMCNPAFVYIGYDNWNNHLPEPYLSKVKDLIARLEKFTEVRIKTLRERGIE